MKVLKFAASWCEPCKMLSKTFESIETKHEVVEIDIDENQDLAIKYGIRGVPTLVLVDGETEVKRKSGMMMQKDLLEFLGE